jgi:hypothetical protein
MQRFRSEIELPASAERVHQLLIDPDFQRRKALAGKTLVAEATREDQGEVVVLVLREERKPMMGKEPNRSTMTMRWDAAGTRATWIHVQHGQEKRSSSEGSVELRPLGGERCKLITEGTIEIRVPLIGRSIEKKVVKAIEAERSGERAFYLAELKRQSPS